MSEKYEELAKKIKEILEKHGPCMAVSELKARLEEEGIRITKKKEIKWAAEESEELKFYKAGVYVTRYGYVDITDTVCLEGHTPWEKEDEKFIKRITKDVSEEVIKKVEEKVIKPIREKVNRLEAEVEAIKVTLEHIKRTALVSDKPIEQPKEPIEDIDLETQLALEKIKAKIPEIVAMSLLEECGASGDTLEDKVRAILVKHKHDRRRAYRALSECLQEELV